MDHHRLPSTLTAAEWEAAFAPYDEPTYQAALDFLRPEDVVLDLGAGDLRFARRAALRVKRVVAVEMNAEILPSPPEAKQLLLPTEEENRAGDQAELMIVHADARIWPFPTDITVGVLLMRHCAHFSDYVRKLQASGCTRLITNARWGMAVECVDLTTALTFESAPTGWFACLCGQVGFKSNDTNAITSEVLSYSTTVAKCPVCLNYCL